MALGRHLAGTIGEDDVSAILEHVGDRHGKPPGNMIVTSPGHGKRLVNARASWWRWDGFLGYAGHHFHHLTDEARGDPVIAMASLRLDSHELAVQELR